MSSRIRKWKVRERILNLLRDPTEFAALAERERKLRVREQRISEAEKGIFKSDKWANLVLGDYNPDKIGVPTYRKMAEYDAQVRSGLEILGMGVSGVPWEIDHEDDDVKEFITWNLERLRRPTFDSALKDIMTAHWAGYSVTETVWEFMPDEKKWGLRRELGLKTLDPETIKFFTHQTGRLLKVEQTVGSSPVNLDMKRLLISSFDKKFGNWYGESLLRACYKNWFIKDNMLKFANIAFERFGAPIMLGVAKDIKSSENVEDVLSHLYARSVGVLTVQDKEDPTDIRVIESKRATMPFMEYIDYHNRMILQRMLIGEPLLKGGGGVYGPRIPYAILERRLKGVQIEIADVLAYLLDMLVDLNFDTKKPAKLKFGPIPKEEVLGRVEEAMEKSVDLEGNLK